MAPLKNRLRLLRGLTEGGKAFAGPFFVDVDVTTRCNLHCLGCPYHSSKRRKNLAVEPARMEIPLALVERLCKELPELGTHEVILAGDGEPFLHPHLFEIIAAFKRAGCRVQLFTNGTLIDETNARLILDSGLDILNVSFWANSPEEYEKCHPG